MTNPEAEERVSSALPETLERLRLRAHRRSRAHYLAAKSLGRMHTLLGVPTVVLTAAVGTSIFATLAADKSSNLFIGVGLTSLVASLLAALQTLFRFAERSEKHRVSGAAYSAAKRRLDLLKVALSASAIPIVEAHSKLSELVESLNSLEAECLDIPDRFYDRARQEQTDDSEGV